MFWFRVLVIVAVPLFVAGLDALASRRGAGAEEEE
jgi:hypothetical protein